LRAAAPTHCSSLGAGSDFTNYQFAFFTADDQRLVDQLMEIIIPRDEHSPGAHAARVPAFADLMVSSGSDAVKERWRTGLEAFRKASVNSPLQDVLRRAAAEEANPQSETGKFFVDLKRMTIDGYYTSGIGIHEELRYQGNEYRTSAPACHHPEHGASKSAL
jgi:hypothetical protein